MGRRHRDYKAEWQAQNTGPEGPEGTDREPVRMCPTSGKRMYASEAEANATAGHQMAKQSGVQLRIYLCIYCSAWHLTSKGR